MEGLIEKVTLDLRNEGITYVELGGKIALGGANGQCKGPMAESCLVGSGTVRPMWLDQGLKGRDEGSIFFSIMPLTSIFFLFCLFLFAYFCCFG